MSLEFVIIPSKQDYEDYAVDVESLLCRNITHNTHIHFDKDYDKTLNNRISRWEKNDYDIIIVDEDYFDTNTIIVKFSDKGSTSDRMFLADFIELVSSFEDDDNNDKTNDSEDEENGCVIM